MKEIQKNISDDQLGEIKSTIEEMEAFMSESIDWTLKSPDVSNKLQKSKKLKSYRRIVRRIARVVDQKPAIAFFGASQSGKSHLVKNLLQDDVEKKLFIYDRSTDQTIDYLKSINPEGKGNESTALVTRFVEKDSRIYGGNKPIQIELLTVKDLILCVCDGFYSVGKIDQIDFQFTEKIQECISNMTVNQGAEGGMLSEDDIYFIKGYLEKYKKGAANLFLKELEVNKFWDHLANEIDNISWNNYSKIFDIFWCEQPQFSQLFHTLLSCLGKVNFSKFIYCDFNVITRNLPEYYVNQFSEITNILDVRSLENILNESKSFAFETGKGEISHLSGDLLCALCKEIVLEIPTSEQKDSEFLHYLDILDFPGSRPGTPISVDTRVSNKDLGQALLRGKVNFLFNTYSDEFQLNNLAIVSCLAEQKDGAGQIPEILNNWINNYIGSTPVERQNSIDPIGIPPLFVILTFWNRILHYDPSSDNPDPKERLDTAFITRFNQDLLSNNTWYRDWLPHKKEFQNFYLLRDFKYCNIFEKDMSRKELEVKSDQSDYLNNANSYFQGLEEVKNYFANPHHSWESATSANKDGSDLIIKNFFQITSNLPKTNRFINIVNKTFEDFLFDLPKVKGGDSGELIRDAKRKAQDISARLGVLVEDGASLGELQELFMLREQEVYENLLLLVRSYDSISASQLKRYFTFLFQHPELKSNINNDQKLEILMEKFGYDSKEKMKEYLEKELKFDLRKLFDKDLEKMKKKSTYISEGTKDYWIENILNAEDKTFDAEIISPEVIKILSNVLSGNFMELNMVDYIADLISEYVDKGELNDKAYFMISNIISGTINNFVMTAGWKYTELEEQVRIRKIASTNNVASYDITTEEKFNIEAVELELVQNVFDNLENEVNIINESLENNHVDVISKSSTLYGLSQWQDFLKLAFMANLDSIDYDEKSNDELKEIMSKTNDLVVTIQ